MSGIDTRILVTNANGQGRYLSIRTFADRMTITDESTAQVMSVALSTSVAGDNNGDQTAATLPLETVWGISATNMKDATQELSGEIASMGQPSYILRTADPLIPNATVLSTLATGLLKSTTTTGALSIALNSDLPSMTATVGGAVPTPPNDSTQFLNGQGVFSVPNATGSLTQSFSASTLTTSAEIKIEGTTGSAGSRNSLYLHNSNSVGNQSNAIIIGSAGTGISWLILNDLAEDGTQIRRLCIYDYVGGTERTVFTGTGTKVYGDIEATEAIQLGDGSALSWGGTYAAFKPSIRATGTTISLDPAGATGTVLSVATTGITVTGTTTSIGEVKIQGTTGYAGSRNSLFLYNTNVTGNQSNAIVIGSAGVSISWLIANDLDQDGTKVRCLSIYDYVGSAERAAFTSTGLIVNGTVNNVTITTPATGSTLTIADNKTLTASNTLTFSGTDGSTLAIGTGGTLGTAAYTNSDAYASSGAPGSAVSDHAALTTGVHGLGTASQRSDTYFALLAGSSSQAFATAALTASGEIKIQGTTGSAGTRNSLYLYNTNSVGNQCNAIVIGSAGIGVAWLITNDFSEDGTQIRRLSIYDYIGSAERAAFNNAGLIVNGTVTGTSFNSITALASSVSPMNGSAAVGTSTTVARQDHVHASDTSRALLGGSSSQAFSTAALTATGPIDFNGGASEQSVTIQASSLSTAKLVLKTVFASGRTEIAATDFPLRISYDGTAVAGFSSTGLAVTGVTSSTGGFSSTGTSAKIDLVSDYPSTFNPYINLTVLGTLATRITAKSTGISFSMDGGDGTTERMLLSSTGLAVTGTTSANQFTASSATHTYCDIQSTAADKQIGLRFYDNSTFRGSFTYEGGTRGDLASIDFGTKKLALQHASSGTVLIGTATAVTGAKLEVAGSGSFTGTLTAGDTTLTASGYQPLALYRPYGGGSAGVELAFKLNNSAASPITYAAIFGDSIVATAGSETGGLVFSYRSGGGLVTGATLNATGLAVTGAISTTDTTASTSTTTGSMKAAGGLGVVGAVFSNSISTVGPATVGTTFGCNGKASQPAYTVSAAAYDGPTTTILVNQIRAALIANGICI